MKSCLIPGCDRPSRARGLCPKHYQRLKKTGNPNITKWDKNKYIEITPALRDYIDGVVLSDGHLSHYSGTKRSSTRLSVRQCLRRSDWIYKIQWDLLYYNIKSKIYYEKPQSPIISKKHGPIKGTGSVRLQTLHYTLFNWFYSRWYSNKIKKVPRDLTISPTLIANWYLGDGTFFPEKCHARIKLCTCSFTEEDIAYLISSIKKTLGITHIRMTPDDKCIIILSQKDVMKFVNYIPKEFRLPSFQYKFRWSK